MSPSFSKAAGAITSFVGFVGDLLADGLRFFRQTLRSHSALSAEILFLRKQLAFYEERQVQPHRLNDSARLALAFWSRLFDWKQALIIVKPETLVGWHRKGFKLFWKWKSRVGRPRWPENICRLIVRMAQENPTWGQACVAAELSLKLGIYVSPRTVRAYWPPEPARAPQANAHCERLVGTVGRECLDFMILMSEKHLGKILAEWVIHYNQGRPHSSLGPGIPEPLEMVLPPQLRGRHYSVEHCKVATQPILGGLHHEYRWERIAA